MKYLLVFIASFLMVTAYGRTFHDIEFELPEEAVHWSCQEIGQKRHEALIYAPQETDLNENFEFFSVSVHPLALELANPSTLAWLFTRLYPDMEVKFEVLNTYADGLLYHWHADDHGEEKIHGWGRVFLTHSALVQLNYVTEKMKPGDVSEAIWLPVLLSAENQSHFP